MVLRGTQETLARQERKDKKARRGARVAMGPKEIKETEGPQEHPA